MPRSIAAYLADIIDACDHILDAAASQSLEAYQSSKTIRRAVERDFQIIGEGLIQLRDRAPELYARVPDAELIIGFRHILVHAYFNLDDRTVWDTIIYDVRPLRELIAVMLTSADAEETPDLSQGPDTDPSTID